MSEPVKNFELMNKFNIGDKVITKNKNVEGVVEKTFKNVYNKTVYCVKSAEQDIIKFFEDELELVKKDYKDISNKLPLQDIHPIALETLGKVLQYGIEKYGYENRTSYKHGEIDTYIGAMLRHLIAYQKGEILDESELSHLEHLFFNAYVLIYLDYIKRGE